MSITKMCFFIFDILKFLEKKVDEEPCEAFGMRKSIVLKK